jgi:glycosyltransferase involved in cell wall biosynthesis
VSTLAVLITYHNEGSLLRRCLLSLRAQTMPVDEILIYDDASDDSPEPYLVAGLPIRIIRGCQNIGPARGRNVLLHESRSALIHFHDADDAFSPTWREDVGRAFDRAPVDAVFTEVGWVEQNGARRDSMVGLEAVKAGADLLTFAIRHRILTPTGTYQRSAVLAIGGYRSGLWQAEDWDFHIRLAARGLRYRVLLRPLVVVYRRPDGRSEQRLEVWRSELQAIGLLASELPASCRQDLCDEAARVGSAMYQAGFQTDARDAFRLADRLGRPSFADRPGFYRTVARCAGSLQAERLGVIWRGVVPSGLRQRLPSRRD